MNDPTMFQIPTDKALTAQVEALRRELAELKRAQAGKPKRRTDPELTGLYPQKSGVSVYLRGVGPGVKRALYYLGIGRDIKAAKDIQENGLRLIEWTLAAPADAAELLAYWEARGRHPWLTMPAEPVEQPTAPPCPPRGDIRAVVDHQFGALAQFVE
jgi:hypothetical protein